jgi:hypothetical protein
MHTIRLGVKIGQGADERERRDVNEDQYSWYHAMIRREANRAVLNAFDGIPLRLT